MAHYLQRGSIKGHGRVSSEFGRCKVTYELNLDEIIKALPSVLDEDAWQWFAENINSGNHMKTLLRLFACNIASKMYKRGFEKNWKVTLKNRVRRSLLICVK